MIILLKNKHVHFIGQQLARVSNIDGCLNFVAGQHPHLDASRFEISDCLSDFILQFILDGRRADQFEVLLNQFSTFIYRFFFASGH